MANLREHTTIFYSTHILDDVQRVSDTVAIIHQGKLVAQAPIGELLSGRKGETTYTIAISGEVGGRAPSGSTSSPGWRGIEESQENGGVRWLVHATDAAAAEATLLRSILASDRVTVTSFGRQTHDLEDVFLRVVEEADTMPRDPALVAVPVAGWRTGFLNMLAKEHGVWWRTRRWAVHLVLWIVVTNGFLLLTFGDHGPTPTSVRRDTCGRSSRCSSGPAPSSPPWASSR